MDVDDAGPPVRADLDGGDVTDRIEIGGRAAIACALGGPERRTLFLLSSTDAYPQAPSAPGCARRDREGRHSRRGLALTSREGE